MVVRITILFLLLALNGYAACKTVVIHQNENWARMDAGAIAYLFEFEYNAEKYQASHTRTGQLNTFNRVLNELSITDTLFVVMVGHGIDDVYSTGIVLDVSKGVNLKESFLWTTDLMVFLKQATKNVCRTLIYINACRPLYFMPKHFIHDLPNTTAIYSTETVTVAYPNNITPFTFNFIKYHHNKQLDIYTTVDKINKFFINKELYKCMDFQNLQFNQIYPITAEIIGELWQ